MSAIIEAIMGTLQRGGLGLAALLVIAWLEMRGLEHRAEIDERWLQLKEAIAENRHAIARLPPPDLVRDVGVLSRTVRRTDELLRELAHRIIYIEAQIGKPMNDTRTNDD